ncbi:MAG: antitoxin [Rhodoferax sp.]|nr:antitoxin [Rhodoferax sp.]MDP3650185.1 antitoxin [Rhodoferax sp.]
MKAEYDLSKLKSRKNPYASIKGMADEVGVPYQRFINLYLRDCLANSRKVQIKWPQSV